MRMKRKISFYKDGYEWYADVPFIAKAHNLMDVLQIVHKVHTFYVRSFIITYH